MRIALSTDHAGYERLKSLRHYLEQLGYECVYYGPAELNADDDYPDYIKPAAEAVAGGECQMGIIMGGSGQGEAIVANRIQGVRCCVYYGPIPPLGVVESDGQINKQGMDVVRLSREHNDANMISIGARFVNDLAAQAAVKLWLDTPFSEEPRHKRRISKIDG